MLSSRAKGESIIDTIYTLQEMQVDVFVIRDAEPGIHEYVARHVGAHVGVISGGEAHLSHPTQGLLDALTIRQCKGGFRDLVVTITGDIRHSRVARSAHRALTTLGVAEIRIVAPTVMMPDGSEFAGARRFESFDEAIEGADVVMMLRIQRERVAGAGPTDIVGYHQQFGLNATRLARARPQAIVMHPGPMNRGVEITSDVADGPQSVIRRQVANGVAMRMAVLAHLAEARGRRAP
jgi:aspartate carbamoyltransferase catalytic subunit